MGGFGETMKVTIPDDLRPWLEELAETGLYGNTPHDVARYFVCRGLEKELRGGGEGFLRNPPPKPRRKEL